MAAGEAKSAPCLACHGPGGKSTNPEWPNLAGQHEHYIARQLEDFKEGRRSNPLMSPMAMALSEQDMFDLGAYYAAQPEPTGEADAGLVERGERLYRGGNTEIGAAACIACHGPTGRGNPLAEYPSIAGQHATYVEVQLAAYRSGERTTDENQMMRNIASRLSDDEIRAVASYIQGLRPAE